eukprot:TRINITY_DN13636_c0_g1_i2.p1 TRINITY_DN13636_c0_g1~~TRINITY_DN13636_c0_g1_i2.p1  ORF type:complete len:632 (-),score=61.45 TRINITY_DN13636_c0_g1_i2:214-2109(-)
MLAKNEKFLRQQDGSHYSCVIVDESQFMKDFKSKRTQAACTACKSSRRAILLSGTPALNCAAELFTQMDALLFNQIPSFSSFAQRYCQKVTQRFAGRTVERWTGSRMECELNLLLTSSVMIRRLKRDVLSQLPEKTRQRVALDKSQMDKASIRQLSKLMLQLKNDVSELSRTSEHGAQVSAGMAQLFKLSAEAKCSAVLEHVETLLDGGVKLLCFAHHTFMLDKLTERLQNKAIQHIRIDGKTSPQERPTLVSRFQEDDSVRVAVLSITACGQGLTLTAASTVVFAELFWVPGQLLQAEDRVHRIGQKSACLIQYLIAPRTIDDHIFSLIDRKQCVVTGIVDGVVQGMNAQLPSAKPSEKADGDVSCGGAHSDQLPEHSEADKCNGLGCVSQTDGQRSLPMNTLRGDSSNDVAPERDALCVSGGRLGVVLTASGESLESLETVHERIPTAASDQRLVENRMTSLVENHRKCEPQRHVEAYIGADDEPMLRQPQTKVRSNVGLHLMSAARDAAASKRLKIQASACSDLQDLKIKQQDSNSDVTQQEHDSDHDPTGLAEVSSCGPRFLWQASIESGAHDHSKLESIVVPSDSRPPAKVVDDESTVKLENELVDGGGSHLSCHGFISNGSCVHL